MQQHNAALGVYRGAVGGYFLDELRLPAINDAALYGNIITCVRYMTTCVPTGAPSPATISRCLGKQMYFIISFDSCDQQPRDTTDLKLSPVTP